ncbi:MAG TPA: coniferyl-aldehyde dehydrogenase [Desulfobacteraceae bacterium]|nr:coniferyl-aldehyde dehydrogenase [Desulfobacteraceae bacterium]|tara:strand:- start:363 stop:1781 length:1419 start_codon:yes stop_codon:yes gene_type:complete
MAESEKSSPQPITVFDAQTAAMRREPVISYEKRIQLLETIERLIVENDDAICEAISQDFGNRSMHETRILEISGSLLGLRYTRKRLKRWMSPQRRHVSMLFAGSRNRVIPQAKGIVGIVTPWNYPLFLSISPMTSAIAAGNRVMVKLASNSQRLCRLLHRIFSKEIDDAYLCFLPGAAASEFAGLPFNHLVFTGSPEVGKTVMKTAAASLTPVTLELGGKSPTVIAQDYPMEKAVARIMYAKLMNAGQTCIAPDYLFVPGARLPEFIRVAKQIVTKRYPDIRSSDYTSIIDSRAFDRLTETLEDASAKGAELVNLLDGPDSDPELRKISPTLLTGVSRDMRVMREEIFGPLFPVMPYSDPEEVIDYINAGERPLALYLFTNDRRLTEQVLARTISGGVTLNDCAMHVAQHDMPFGGIGNSGMGHYHGYEGFAEFSKLKPVFRQSGFALSFAPPYGSFIRWIYRMVKQLRWLS